MENLYFIFITLIYRNCVHTNHTNHHHSRRRQLFVHFTVSIFAVRSHLCFYRLESAFVSVCFPFVFTDSRVHLSAFVFLSFSQIRECIYSKSDIWLSLVRNAVATKRCLQYFTYS